MRIPASVLKGIRVGLSGTSLALAVGCNTQPSAPASDAAITREVPVVAAEKQGVALDKRDSPRWTTTQDPAVSRVESAPPSSPFLVDPSATQSSRVDFGEPNEPAAITPVRQIERINRVQPIATEEPVIRPIGGEGNKQGWRARACGRG